VACLDAISDWWLVDDWQLSHVFEGTEHALCLLFMMRIQLLEISVVKHADWIEGDEAGLLKRFDHPRPALRLFQCRASARQQLDLAKSLPRMLALELNGTTIHTTLEMLERDNIFTLCVR
jgi:hypothetical protein